MADAHLPENEEVTHEREHTKEKPYTCSYPECVRKFASRYGLFYHERTHTGEKPYICSYPKCVRKFITKECLKIHERTHTSEKLYACGYHECGRNFVTKGNLKAHVRTHTDENHTPHPMKVRRATCCTMAIRRKMLMLSRRCGICKTWICGKRGFGHDVVSPTRIVQLRIRYRFQY